MDIIEALLKKAPIILAVLYYVYTFVKGLKKKSDEQVLPIPQPISIPQVKPYVKVAKQKKADIIESNSLENKYKKSYNTLENTSFEIPDIVIRRDRADSMVKPRFKFENMDEIKKAIVMKEILDRKYC